MCELLGMNCNTPTDICFSFSGFSERGGAAQPTCTPMAGALPFLKEKACAFLTKFGKQFPRAHSANSKKGNV